MRAARASALAGLIARPSQPDGQRGGMTKVIEALRIDQRVRVVFKSSNGGRPVPMFAPS